MDISLFRFNPRKFNMVCATAILVLVMALFGCANIGKTGSSVMSDLVEYAGNFAKGVDWVRTQVTDKAAIVLCATGTVDAKACDIYKKISENSAILANAAQKAADNYANNRTEENKAVLSETLGDLAKYWLKLDALYKTNPEQYAAVMAKLLE